MTTGRSEFTKSLSQYIDTTKTDSLGRASLFGEVLRWWPVSYYLLHYPSPLREFPWQTSRQLLPSQLSKPSLTLTSVIILLNAVHQPAASVAFKNPFGNPLLALNSKSSQKTWKCEKISLTVCFLWFLKQRNSMGFYTFNDDSDPSIIKHIDRKWEIFTFLVGIFILRSSASRLRTCQGACIRTKLTPWLLFWNIKKRGKMYLNILEYNVVLISQAVSSNKIIQQ